MGVDVGAGVGATPVGIADGTEGAEGAPPPEHDDTRKPSAAAHGLTPNEIAYALDGDRVPLRLRHHGAASLRLESRTEGTPQCALLGLTRPDGRCRVDSRGKCLAGELGGQPPRPASSHPHSFIGNPAGVQDRVHHTRKTRLPSEGRGSRRQRRYPEGIPSGGVDQSLNDTEGTVHERHGGRTPEETARGEVKEVLLPRLAPYERIEPTSSPSNDRSGLAAPGLTPHRANRFVPRATFEG